MIYVTKNNGKTVCQYSDEKYDKFKKALTDAGYRQLTDAEVKVHLTKKGYVEKENLETKTNENAEPNAEKKPVKEKIIKEDSQ